jgi:hypothetical protein
MSTTALVARYGPPAALGVISTAAITFAINFLTNGGPRWWWIVVVVSGVGMVGATVWGYRQRGGSDDPAPLSPIGPQQAAQQDAGVAQQSATGNGTNISISADRNSVAAGEIGTLNMGPQPPGPTTKP